MSWVAETEEGIFWVKKTPLDGLDEKIFGCWFRCFGKLDFAGLCGFLILGSRRGRVRRGHDVAGVLGKGRRHAGGLAGKSWMPAFAGMTGGGVRRGHDVAGLLGERGLACWWLGWKVVDASIRWHDGWGGLGISLQGVGALAFSAPKPV
jgi:hypothetical protein